MQIPNESHTPTEACKDSGVGQRPGNSCGRAVLTPRSHALQNALAVSVLLALACWQCVDIISARHLSVALMWQITGTFIVLLVAYWFLAEVLHRANSVMSPFWVVGVPFVIAVLGRPFLGIALSGDETGSRLYPIYVPGLLDHFRLSLLGFVGLACGTLLVGAARRQGGHNPLPPMRSGSYPVEPRDILEARWVQSISTMLLIAATVAFVAFSAGAISKLTLGEGTAIHGQNQHTRSLGQYVRLLATLGFLPLVASATYATAITQHRVLTRPVAACVASYVVLTMLAGGRMEVVAVVAIIVMVHHNLIRPVTMRQMFLGTMVLALILFVPLKLRNNRFSITDGLGAATTAGIGEPISALISSVSVIPLHNTRIMQVYPEHKSYCYGLTLLHAVPNLLPAFLFGDKLDRPFIQGWRVFADAFQGGVKANMGWSFNIFSESYLNFGWFGAFGGMALLGYLLQQCYFRVLRAGRQRWWSLPWYCVLVTVINLGWRTDVQGTIKALVYAWVFLRLVNLAVPRYARTRACKACR